MKINNNNNNFRKFFSTNKTSKKKNLVQPKKDMGEAVYILKIKIYKDRSRKLL
jgi:hypothetical protein